VNFCAINSGRNLIQTSDIDHHNLSVRIEGNRRAIEPRPSQSPGLSIVAGISSFLIINDEIGSGITTRFQNAIVDRHLSRLQIDLRSVLVFPPDIALCAGFGEINQAKHRNAEPDVVANQTKHRITV
jgi:hypothetical protein